MNVLRPLAVRVIDEFVLFGRSGQQIEKNLGIRRELFEAALRQAIIEQRPRPSGPGAEERPSRLGALIPIRRAA